MYDVPSLIGRLRGVRHFNQLSLTDLHTIVSSGQLLRFKAGAVIFREGDACSGLYVLLAGKVHLDKAGPQGQSTLMASIRPVIMFNEVSVLDGDCNPLSATTVKDSICWQISHERFQRLMLVYPTLGISLLNVLARRNRQLITRCEDIAFRTVMGRLAKILLELSKNGRAISTAASIQISTWQRGLPRFPSPSAAPSRPCARMGSFPVTANSSRFTSRCA
jgi:CRP-like cAMP-binding protein